MLHNLGLINGGAVQGAGTGADSIRSALAGLRQLGVERFRAMAPLPDDAQRLFDKAVIDVGLDRLTITPLLMRLGLTYPLSDWLGVPSIYWERASRHGQAQNAMNPSARGETSLPDRTGRTFPVFCTFDDFDITERLQATSERAGMPLTTDQIKTATRNVHELIENNHLNGGLTVQGNSSPGFINAPSVNSYTIPLAWDNAAKTGPLIKTDMKAMIAKLRVNRFNGPYEFLVSNVYDDVLNDDYYTAAAGTSQTIRSRLLEMEYGGRAIGITVVDQLADDTVICFQATEEVVRLVPGQEPVPITYQITPFETTTIVLASILLNVRDNYDGKSGVCKGTV